MNPIVQTAHAFLPSDRIAMIIRHSDRDLIPEGSFGDDLSINKEGIERAKHFGTQLKDLNVNAIYTSPILRCVQTAECIKEGLERPVEIHQANELGDPGLHIADAELAGVLFPKYGVDGIYYRFIKGDSLPGFATREQLSKSMSNFISTHTAESGVTLFITHDIVVALYQYCEEGRVYEPYHDWIDYLDGLCVKI